MVRESVKNVFGRNEPTLIEPAVPTSRVKKVIELAFEAAKAESSSQVGSEHVLVGLIEEGGGLGGRVLQDLGVTVERVQLQRGAPAHHAWPRPGERVLLHDAEPPYRLWEGTATAREGGQVKVSVPGHPDRCEATVPTEELHAIPLRLYPGCKRCSFRL
jgi:hypothetical protein